MNETLDSAERQEKADARRRVYRWARVITRSRCIINRRRRVVAGQRVSPVIAIAPLPAFPLPTLMLPMLAATPVVVVPVLCPHRNGGDRETRAQGDHDGNQALQHGTSSIRMRSRCCVTGFGLVKPSSS